jgi:hypothetical protein
VKKLIIAAAFALSFTAVGAFAEEWTGVIGDSKCGAKHDEAHMNAKCVETCVKGGASPVFIVGDKVYKIDDASKVADHLGHKVTITGSLDGDTVKVDSVKM